MKHKNRWLLTILAVFIVHYSISGETIPTEQTEYNIHSIDSSAYNTNTGTDLQVLFEEMAENGMDTEQLEERLSELANNPVPLNEANREMLEGIPILNSDQVENLSYYLYRYGPIVNLSELMLVEGMDAKTVRWLKPFVQIGKITESPIEAPSMKKALHYGKQDLRWSIGSTLQKKAGYIIEQEDSSGQYIGDPIHATMRYGFNYKNQLQWGFVMEKDPGEAWWNSRLYSPDFFTFHFMAKDTKRKNSCILGDYTVRFGQGLVCGNAFSLGKNTTGLLPEQTGSIISRHFSSSEINFFRGAAVRLTLKPYLQDNKKRFGMELCTFLSNKRVDSSVENGVTEGLGTTGLHRTLKELSNHDRLKQSVVGSHLRLRWTNLEVGLGGIAWMQDASMVKATEPWKVFHTYGKSGGNVSANFRMVFEGLLLYGEMAIDQQAHTAIVAGTTYKPYPRMSLSLLGRKYSPAYESLFSNAFSEGGTTRNEEGFYGSMDLQLAKKLKLTGYADVFRFPWLNYAVNTPSWGQDIAMELNATVGRNGNVKLVVKSKIKEKYDVKTPGTTHPTIPSVKNQMRLQISQKTGLWSMKTVFYGNTYQFKDTQTIGVSIAQDLGIETNENRFSMMLHAVLFQTEAWENRIYLWEKELPGAFAMPMLYGRGSRLAFLANYNFRNMNLQFKIADSVQPGMETLGVGPELIVGNRRTEARLLLSWKF